MSTGRATLVAQLAELADVLTDPEALEISSLFSAIARAHGLGWGRKPMSCCDTGDAEPTI
jgi:hypothetical protein